MGKDLLLIARVYITNRAGNSQLLAGSHTLQGRVVHRLA